MSRPIRTNILRVVRPRESSGASLAASQPTDFANQPKKPAQKLVKTEDVGELLKQVKTLLKTEKRKAEKKKK